MMTDEKELKENTEKEETAEAETPDEQETETKSPEEEASEKIKKLETQVAVLKNEYAKAYADTENMRKRLQNDFDQRSKYQLQKFAAELLPVLDNCERALAQQTADENYRKGFEMVYSQLKAALEKEGVTEIEAEGQPFDGNWHQALMSEHRADTEPGIVIQVLQKGYKLKDRILRAALVKVSE